MQAMRILVCVKQVPEAEDTVEGPRLREHPRPLRELAVAARAGQARGPDRVVDEPRVGYRPVPGDHVQLVAGRAKVVGEVPVKVAF